MRLMRWGIVGLGIVLGGCSLLWTMEAPLKNEKATRKLLTATQFGKLNEVMLALLDNADVDACYDTINATPLHLACHNGDLEIVTYLLHAGARVDVCGESGSTPLHWAAARGNTEIALELIGRGAAVDAVNKFGRTPLHRAVYNGRVAMAATLLGAGAPIDACDDEGKSSLHRAVEIGHSSLVKMLLSKEASTGLRDLKGNMPLHYAVALFATRQRMAPQDAQRWIMMIAEFLAHGANIYANDGGSKTPFDTIMHAAGPHQLTLIHLFLMNGVRTKSEDEQVLKSMLSELHYAALYVSVVEISVLIDESTIKPADFQIALALAVGQGRTAIVRLLLTHEVKPRGVLSAVLAIIRRLKALGMEESVPHYRFIESLLRASV